ncbi:DNA replication and repair protein RecF [Pelagibacterales bacterium SAG-MED31]|nr:DNA replication and repair protein RecF [Pelagibacterales bacterium SAG-MED31]
MGYFKNIKLKNFRNFKDFEVEFSDRCNVFYGRNGCGKTNLLEAISLCSKGRGIRKDKIFNFIQKDEVFFSNITNFVDQNIEYEFKVISDKKNNKLQKKIYLNDEISNEVNKKIQSLITFLVYLPENERLFIASPTTRRNLLDHFIYSNNEKYNTLLNFYKKNIYERHIILNNNIIDQNWLEKIEDNISKSGIEIYENRIKQNDIFEKNFQEINKYFNVPFKLNIEIQDKFYKTKPNIENYKNILKLNREIDKIIGGSKIGPHKSDIIYFVDENYPASQLSTGQQKTLVLLLYFAQCYYLVNNLKKKPILLLDEINSHLDDVNTQLLLKIVNQFEIQVFMTGTKKNLFSFLSTNTNFYNISKT